MARLSDADKNAAIELAFLYRQSTRTTTNRAAERVSCEIAGLENGIRTYRNDAALAAVRAEAVKVNQRVAANAVFLAARIAA